MFREITDGIEVAVVPTFLDDESTPEEGRYVWAYQVRIANHSAATVRVRGRYWRITDARGRVQEVRGAGVVGEQPLLHPGEAFEYMSGTPLATPSGFMVGRYQLEREDGTEFEVAIPAFSLDSPYHGAQVH